MPCRKQHLRDSCGPFSRRFSQKLLRRYFLETDPEGSLALSGWRVKARTEAPQLRSSSITRRPIRPVAPVTSTTSRTERVKNAPAVFHFHLFLLPFFFFQIFNIIKMPAIENLYYKTAFLFDKILRWIPKFFFKALGKINWA